MYEKCSYFLLNSGFSGKIVFLRKLKLIYSNNSSALQQLLSSYLFKFFQKNFHCHAYVKKMAETIHSTWNITKESQRTHHSSWQIYFLQNCKAITAEENWKNVWKIIYLIFQITCIFLTQFYYNMNFITSSSISSENFPGTLRSIFADCFWKTFLEHTKIYKVLGRETFIWCSI